TDVLMPDGKSEAFTVSQCFSMFSKTGWSILREAWALMRKCCNVIGILLVQTMLPNQRIQLYARRHQLRVGYTASPVFTTKIRREKIWAFPSLRKCGEMQDRRDVHPQSVGHTGAPRLDSETWVAGYPAQTPLLLLLR